MQQLDWSLRLPEGARLESRYNRPISVRYADGTLVHYTPKALTRQDRFEPLAKLFWQAQAERARGTWLDIAKEIATSPAPDFMETGYLPSPKPCPPIVEEQTAYLRGSFGLREARAL